MTAAQSVESQTLSGPDLWVRVKFDCGHSNWITRDEYGDGSAHCNACGEIQVYARCLTCGSLDCQSKDGPTLAHA